MASFINFLNRYAFGLFGLVKAYCDFAGRHARHEADLLFLGISPVVLLALASFHVAEMAWRHAGGSLDGAGALCRVHRDSHVRREEKQK